VLRLLLELRALHVRQFFAAFSPIYRPADAFAARFDPNQFFYRVRPLELISHKLFVPQA